MSNITLRRLKTYPRLSERATAFSANVYVDGKFIGVVSCDGRSHMLTHDIPPKVVAELKDFEPRVRALVKEFS